MDIGDLKTVRISRKVLDEVKNIQREKIFPINANDSLVLSLALHRLFEEVYRSDRLNKKEKEKFRNAILNDIKILQDENFVDKNCRGYDKK